MHKVKVLVVDDDKAVRDSLGALLEVSGFSVDSYDSGQEFLTHRDLWDVGCVLLDVNMPDVSGLEIQQELTKKSGAPPIIIITGFGDIPMAVKAIRAGAFDFVEKPFVDKTILDSINRAIDQNRHPKSAESSTAEATQNLKNLTKREREVLSYLVEGLQNKVIAYQLGISPRTVEIHRARVMSKMQAKSLSHLVRMALAAGIAPIS